MKKTVTVLGILILTGCSIMVPIKVGPPKDITVEATPERLARGDYLVNTVTHCLGCHSDLDPEYYSYPPKPGTEGSGGFKFEDTFGAIYAPNITPSAIGDWTDGELIRAITEGVNKSGSPLFPIMPYEWYRTMDQEDLYSIVAYIRTLDPIQGSIPERELKFPLEIIVRTMPKPQELKQRPDPSDLLKYGEYLASIGNCKTCHTPFDKRGRPVQGMFLAGGAEFHLIGGGIVRSANITPHPETGLGNRSKAEFIGMFKAFKDPIKMSVDDDNGNTVMPWKEYSDMTEEDLGAMYDYLKSVKPINNQVEKWPAAN